MHALAAHRVVAELHCHSPAKLETIHRVLFNSPSEHLVRTVERLFIHEQTFPNYHRLVSKGSTPYNDVQQAWLLANVLNGTKNLAVLKLPCVTPLILCSPGILHALLSLDHLTVLQLHDVDNTAFHTLRDLRCRHRLTALSLAQGRTYYSFDHSDNRAITSYGFLGFLAAFPKLRWLELINMRLCCPDGSLFDIYNSPLFPTIREVTLDAVAPLFLAFMSLCPNVETAKISCVDASDYQREGGPHLQRWAPLRTLVLDGLEIGDELLKRLHTANHLLTDGDLTITSGTPRDIDFESLIALFQTVSPIGLTCGLHIEDCVPGTLLQEVACAAPRLRYAHFTVEDYQDFYAEDSEVKYDRRLWMVSGANALPAPHAHYIQGGIR